jgi:cell division transport system ATP-binding protein
LLWLVIPAKAENDERKKGTAPGIDRPSDPKWGFARTHLRDTLARQLHYPTHAASPTTAIHAMTLLRFDAVSKRYASGHEALSEVSFAVEPGEMLFVTGHSGAGKSTLLRLIHLAEQPSRGTVLMEDRNLAKLRGRKIALQRRRVGVVFQDHRLLFDRSVYENVAMPLVIAGVPRAEIGPRVRRGLEKVGLADRERAKPRELSTGEQQRVGIARAVVAQPPLLIADEPTGNLDPTLAVDIMELFASLPALGTTVIVASHDLMLVKRMRKRVLVLDHGRVLDDISATELAS